MELLVATRSAGKIREIRRILGSVEGLAIRDLDDAGVTYEPEEEALEPYDTFEANALSKARYFFGKSGLPTVADDSGIEVFALGGAPGVRSKRFAADAHQSEAAGKGEAPDPVAEEGHATDDANNRHLVDRLANVSPADRTARYVCVAVLVDGDADPIVVRGEAPGLIVDEPAGRGGFGYDPYVFNVELGKTFAEMTAEEKDVRSHRGNAFRALADTLAAALQGRGTVSDREGS